MTLERGQYCRTCGQVATREMLLEQAKKDVRDAEASVTFREDALLEAKTNLALAQASLARLNARSLR